MRIKYDQNNKPTQQRKIKPTRRGVSGVYVFRGETSIAYESTLERDYLICAEYEPEVLDIIPQPVQIPFTGTNNREYLYTPDYLVYYKLGDRQPDDYIKPALVEIKYREELKENWRKWSCKWKQAISEARYQGWRFRIFDETRIRTQRLENINFLQRYKNRDFSLDDIEMFVEVVRSMGRCPYHYLLSKCAMGESLGDGIALIWYLLAIQSLRCDLDFPFTKKTELWVDDEQ